MSVVYVVQESPGKNLLPAARFGELRVLLDSRRQVLLSPAPVVSALQRGLAAYTADDWLLLMGDPVSIGIAAAIAAKHTGGVLNLLKWDRQEAVYVPIIIDLKGESYGEAAPFGTEGAR